MDGPPGKQRGKQRPWVLDYDKGLEEVRAYLEEGFSQHAKYVDGVQGYLQFATRWAVGEGADMKRDGKERSDVVACEV